MLKKSQIQIMNLFRKNVFLRKTIREISMLLEKDGFIKIEKVGKSKLCSIFLNQKIISLLSFLEEQESFERNIPNISKILEFKEFNEDIMLVTGSYVLEKQKKNSDIDLVLIVREKAFEKQKLLENLTSLMIPKIHVLVFSYKDFVDMLLDKKPNFGKEILDKHLIFRNVIKYYALVNEAIEHGFKG